VDGLRGPTCRFGETTGVLWCALGLPGAGSLALAAAVASGAHAKAGRGQVGEGGGKV
jgi:hypothetical protein